MARRAAMRAFNQAGAGGVCTHSLRWEEGPMAKLPFPNCRMKRPATPEESHGALRNHGIKAVCSVMSDSIETPGAVAHQAPLSVGFSRQEYWSGMPCL